MDILLAIFFGLLQGFTEWFPVSSSGHLMLAQTYFGGGTPASGWIFFDIIVELGSMCVVLLVFRNEIYKIIKSFFGIFSELRKGNKLNVILKEDQYKLFSIMIIIASIPTAIIGYIFQKWVESAFKNPTMIAIDLIANGFLLIMTYKLVGSRIIKDLKSKDALYIGTMQGIAVLPGISRSGSTISTGMYLGIEKETVVKFSFILFIPAIIGALVLHLQEVPSFGNALVIPLLAGFIASFIVGYLTIKIFLYIIIKKDIFYMFAIYCWSLSAIILAWIYLF